MGTALIATLTALVLGLLIASAKGNYDTLNNELEHISAKIMQLDSVLADYGPEAREPAITCVAASSPGSSLSGRKRRRRYR